MAAGFSTRNLIKHNPSLPSQVPIFTFGGREANVVKCLAQGRKHHGHWRDLNPYRPLSRCNYRHLVSLLYDIATALISTFGNPVPIYTLW